MARKILSEEEKRSKLMIREFLITCVDGLTGFSNVIESIFPKTEIQQCIIHQIGSTTQYLGCLRLFQGHIPEVALE